MLNTFPPLVSGSSFDAENLKQLVGADSHIHASCAIRYDATDTFFNPGFRPTKGGLTGFGWDGFFYFNGVMQGRQATWFTEATPGDNFRSTRGAFPQRGIVLVTDLGLSIFDESANSLDVWMVFERGATLAMLETVVSIPSNFVPKELKYNNGVIMLTYSGDNFPDVYLYLDFCQDTAYVDLATVVI